MSKEDNSKQRVENMNTGGHLGGTKFGQQPGTNGANHAKPPKQVDEGQNDGEKNE